MAKQKRIVVVYKKSLALGEVLRVLHDTAVGVYYLAYGGAMTPLIDAEGRPTRGELYDGRFELLANQGSMEVFRVVRDRTTAVCYMTYAGGYQTSLIPMVDAEGRILTSNTATYTEL